MPFDFIPDFNGNIPEIMIHFVAIIGIILLPYSVFLEQVNRKDLVKLIGSSCLLAYAIYQGQTVFAIAMAGVALASLVEFTEILLGLHKNSPDELKKYKKMWRSREKD